MRSRATEPLAPACASPSASLLLAWLRRTSGGLTLLHRLQDASRGEVGWQKDEPEIGSRWLPWARLAGCGLWIYAEERERLLDTQIVVDVAFGQDPERRAFTEFRFVSLLRPLWNSPKTKNPRSDQRSLPCSS